MRGRWRDEWEEEVQIYMRTKEEEDKSDESSGAAIVVCRCFKLKLRVWISRSRLSTLCRWPSQPWPPLGTLTHQPLLAFASS